MKKSLLALVLAVAMFANTAVAFACTGVYVGSEVSETGYTYYARTEDFNGAKSKTFVIHPAATHEEGEFIEHYGFKYPMPKETLRYSACQDVPEDNDGCIDPYGAGGANECGVSMSATISTDYNEATEAVDPLVDTGIGEISIVNVVLAQAHTAREGVELIGSIIDEYGACECYDLMVADNNEAWYMAVVSGHQYIAMELPDDVVLVDPNCIMLGDVDVNAENVIASADFVNLPKENGFLVENNGLINVRDTYAPEYGDGNKYRAWGGRHFLAPETYKDLTPEERQFDFMFKPEKKVGIMDIKNLLSYRYEDTEYNHNLPENAHCRPIGVDRQSEDHLFEITGKEGWDLVNTQWQCMGNVEFSVFVPYFTSLMTDTYEDYKAPLDSLYTPESGVWAFRELAILCAEDRDFYGAGVRAYWDEYQKDLIEKHKDVQAKMAELVATDPEAAQAKATELGLALAEESITRARDIKAELLYYMGTAKKEKENAVPFEPSFAKEGIYSNYGWDMKPVEAEEEVVVAPVEEESGMSTGLVVVLTAVITAAVVFVICKKKK